MKGVCLTKEYTHKFPWQHSKLKMFPQKIAVGKDSNNDRVYGVCSCGFLSQNRHEIQRWRGVEMRLVDKLGVFDAAPFRWTILSS